MRSLLAECKKLGYVVHFAGVNMTSEERINTIKYVDRWVGEFSDQPISYQGEVNLLGKLKRFFKRLLKILDKPVVLHEGLDQWFKPQWLDEARSLARREKYTRVMVAYVFHSAFLEAFSKSTIRILDTHDVFSNRNERLKTAGLPAEAGWFSVSESAEQFGVSRANQILAIQPTEAGHFKRLTSGAKAVRVVGHFVDVNPLPGSLSGDQLIGYIGSSNPLNTHSLQQFISEIWPLVRNKVPKARLVIAGGVCQAISPPIDSVVLGSVSDPADFYTACIVTINPMQVGTGLKIKTVESMAYGRAVVSTPCGAEGLEAYDGRGLFIASGCDEFASMIADLVLNRKKALVAGLAGAAAMDEMNQRSQDELRLALSGT